MRKLLSFIAALFITGSLFAGGLVTNTNASAAWVRLPSRNASTGIDAVYYNPAGLMKLENGFHVSVSNQSIWQNREVDNNYSGPPATGMPYGLKNRETTGIGNRVYKGAVSAPLYPTVFAVYKMNKLAFSVGFGPVGGGGGATFADGLPSFEMSPSDLVPSLKANFGANNYRMDVNFEGGSIFLGYSGAVSFKINDMISIAAGVRYVTAKNTYQGYLNDIEVFLTGANPPLYGLNTNDWNRADHIMSVIAGSYTTAAAGSTALVTGGLGSQTFAVAQGLGAITAAQRAQFEAALTAVGYPVSTPISAADAIYKGTAAKYNATSSLLVDQSADVTQKGTGYTPFFSVNFSPSDKLNIAVKYEMATKLELTSTTSTGSNQLLTGYDATSGAPVYMFVNGDKVRNDMPAMLTIGVDYKIMPTLKASLGMNYYWDKNADYGHKINGVHVPNSDIIGENGFSIQGGLEYNISKMFLVSAGYIWSNKGANSLYQSDLTYGNATQTYGIGGAYNITDKIQFNLGFGYTAYTTDSKTIDHVFSATGATLHATETYKKNTTMIGLGLDFRF